MRQRWSDGYARNTVATHGLGYGPWKEFGEQGNVGAEYLLRDLEKTVMSLLYPKLAFAKTAEAPTISYGLSGRLYASSSGWILLSVPNALVRGCFAALDEPGVELPPSGPEGGLTAHISVLRPEEIEHLGGPDAISERGKTFHYTLGKLKTVVPHGWKDMSRCWMIEVKSPELEKLRKSYGLSNLPNEGKFAFHITIAVLRKRVLSPGAVRKAASVFIRPQSQIG